MNDVSKKTIWVTGANGFIGTHVLLQGLQHYPHLTWKATSAHAGKSQTKEWFGRTEFTAWNYHTDKDHIPFDFSPEDIMIHSAWGFLPFFKKEEHLTIELPAQKKFLAACIRKGLRNLVVLGTCYEYGMQEGELDEEQNPAHPIMAYPQAKVDLYQWLCSSFPEIQLTWLRLFYMYGKGQSEKSLIPQLEKAILEKRTVFEMSPGDQERDYLPVETMAQFIVNVALKKKSYGVINICSGKPVRVIEFVREYLRKKKATIELKTGVYPYPDYEPFAFWGSRKKLDRVLNNHEPDMPSVRCDN